MTFRLKCLGEPAFRESAVAATATPATSATDGRAEVPATRRDVAAVAEVAVAPRAVSTACDACASFGVKDGSGPGWCGKYRVETFGRYADGCRDGFTPADPMARKMERRRAEVAARLEADPALRYAFDVVNASPTAPAARDVSVMLALRDSTGRIITGELRIPAPRWQGIAVFAAHWRKAEAGKPS